MTSACTRSFRPSPSLSTGVSTHTSSRIQSFLLDENTGWAMPSWITGPTGAAAVAGAEFTASPVTVVATARPSAAALRRAAPLRRDAAGGTRPGVTRRDEDIENLPRTIGGTLGREIRPAEGDARDANAECLRTTVLS
ncbi:hypothetical protein Mro03_06170 [Microbispora rosea subsp. rosea]|nr:hypothetical protein Mro03_06170 [Microbispora rosea subsp. rosea]